MKVKQEYTKIQAKNRVCSKQNRKIGMIKRTQKYWRCIKCWWVKNKVIRNVWRRKCKPIAYNCDRGFWGVFLIFANEKAYNYYSTAPRFIFWNNEGSFGLIIIMVASIMRQRNGIVQNGRQVRIGPEVNRSSHVLLEAVYSRRVVGEVRCVSWNVRCYQKFRRRVRRYSFRVSIK